MMRPVERVLSAIYLEEPDRVPIGELGYHATKRQEITGSDDLALFVDKLDLDIVPVSLEYPKSELDRTANRTGEDTWIDGWGVEWRRKDGMDWYKGPGLKDIREIETLNPPNPDAALIDPVRALAKRFKGKRALVGTLTGPKIPYLARGIDGYIKDLYRNFDLAKRFMDMNTEYDIESGKRLVEAGVDLIAITGDVAYRGGPLVSMKHFRQIFVPAIGECTKAFHKLGVPVVKHTDGNLMPIMEDLVSTGIDGIQSFEPEAGNDMEKVKAEYGDEICIWGNIDLSYTLTRGTKNEVFEKVKNLIATAARGGGFILSSSNNLNHYCKSENYVALVRAGRQYGRYRSTD